MVDLLVAPLVRRFTIWSSEALAMINGYIAVMEPRSKKPLN